MRRKPEQAGHRSMGVTSLRDRSMIEAFLRRNPELHIYSIGDLDDFFWPYTVWHGLFDGAELKAVALLYTGQVLPTLVGLCEDAGPMGKLLESIRPLLPGRFYAHLSVGLEEVFRKTHNIEPHGTHYRMALHNRSCLRDIDCSRAVRLSGAELEDIRRLYGKSYPGNWFEPRMLQTGQYFGIRVGGELVSIAGVHAYSQRYRVAAIGNITTHPSHRRKGYGKLVMARLCRSLAETVDHIGLNVKADNNVAVACYEKLGFEIVTPYGEFTFKSHVLEGPATP